MRNAVWLLGSMALLMAACAPRGPAPTPTAPATGAPPPSPTAAPAAPPTTPDWQRILFPTPEDWAKGAAQPRVTIIEWGDFQ